MQPRMSGREPRMSEMEPRMSGRESRMSEMEPRTSAKELIMSRRERGKSVGVVFRPYLRLIDFCITQL